MWNSLSIKFIDSSWSDKCKLLLSFQIADIPTGYYLFLALRDSSPPSSLITPFIPKGKFLSFSFSRSTSSWRLTATCWVITLNLFSIPQLAPLHSLLLTTADRTFCIRNSQWQQISMTGKHETNSPIPSLPNQTIISFLLFWQRYFYPLGSPGSPP